MPDHSPWYVHGLNTADNALVVCRDDELFKTTIRIRELHWLAGIPPDLDRDYTVRIRYSHRGSAAHIEPGAGGTAEITFREKQRAVTPGQFAVIYRATEVVGSGIIQ